MVGAAKNEKTLMYRSGNTSDIISTILLADTKAAPYTTDIAKTLCKPTVEQTCRAIYNFVKQNIKYKEDPDGLQLVQSPGHLYWGKDGKGRGEGDCKSMSVFCASILQNLGIKYAYRFISQTKGADYHHVFIVVPDERGTMIVLDCVDDSFNKNYPFAKVKDIAPTHAKIGYKIGADKTIFADPTSPTPVVYQFEKNFYSWWDYQLEYSSLMYPIYDKYQKELLDKIDADWRTMAALATIEPISILLLSAKGNNKQSGYFRQLLDHAALHQLMYCYWDVKKAVFPASLMPKLQQANLFKDGLLNSKINKRRTAGSIDNNKTPYWTEFNLRLFCDYHCFLTYGYPLELCLQKAYNTVNFGSDAVPLFKQPYFDLKQNKWIANGASAADMAILDMCLPFDGPMFRPAGEPYWAKGGFVMPNNVALADYTPSTTKAITDSTNQWIAANPAPAGLVLNENRTITTTTPAGTTYTYSGILDSIYYIEWYKKNVLRPRFEPKPTLIDPMLLGDGKPSYKPTTTVGNGKPSIKGKSKIGVVQLAVLIPLITAIVTFLTSLIAIIMDALNKSKAQKDIQNDLTNFPRDFTTAYTSLDGCTIQPVNTGGAITYDKLCPDGSITKNVNPNAPENQPANGADGILGLGKNMSIALLLSLLFAGGYLLFSSSKNTKNGN